MKRSATTFENDEIGRLEDQIQVLRESIDELTTVFEWACRNRMLPTEIRNSLMEADPQDGFQQSSPDRMRSAEEQRNKEKTPPAPGQLF